MRWLFLFFFSFPLFANTNHEILVSIPPYIEIVQEIIGDTATVESVVPPGVNFHTFEPTPRNLDKLFHAKLWFTISDPFEKKIILAMKQSKKDLCIINLHEEESEDPHVWLNPRLVKEQLPLIEEALIASFPEEENGILERRKAFEKKLDFLIEKMDEAFKNARGKTIVVSHATYEYLSRPYEFHELALEQEGKDPTMKEFFLIIQKAKEAHVKTIFTQPDWTKKTAELVAKELGATLYELQPSSPQYFSSMNAIIEAFSHEFSLQEDSHGS